MGTVANLIQEARYDLADYEEGLDFDDRLMFIYVNRMIRLMDSQLAALDSDLMHANEDLIDTVINQDHVDLTNLNNGYWDSIKEIWIGTDRKQEIPYSLMEYKRRWRENQTAEPEYWALRGNQLLWETDCDAAHYDLIIRYRTKHRPRLESWSDTFTANATTDVLTLASGAATFVTGDGPFTVSNSGGALPGGLAASTNYWVIYDPNDTDGLRLASSKAKALGEKEYRTGYTLINGDTYKILAQSTLDFTSYGAASNDVGVYFTCNAASGELGSGDRVLKTQSVNLTSTGSGTHTLTLGNDVMPYNGIFDDFIKEMLVLHAFSKRGQKPDVISSSLFKKRAMEEMIRRNFVPKYYYIDY